MARKSAVFGHNIYGNPIPAKVIGYRSKDGSPVYQQTNHPSGLSRAGLGDWWKVPEFDPTVSALLFLPRDRWPEITVDELAQTEKKFFGPFYDVLGDLGEHLSPSREETAHPIKVTFHGPENNFFIMQVTSHRQWVSDKIIWPSTQNWPKEGGLPWLDLPESLQKKLLPFLVVATRIDDSAERCRAKFKDHQVPAAVMARWFHPGVTQEMGKEATMVVEPSNSEQARRWADWVDREVCSLRYMEPDFALMRTTLQFNRLGLTPTLEKLRKLPFKVTRVKLNRREIEVVASNAGVLSSSS